MILTITLGLIMANMNGTLATSCKERFNATSDPYNDTINKYNQCVTEGFPAWVYLIFLTPFGVFLVLILKKLAFI
jgi:hypothetical protein